METNNYSNEVDSKLFFDIKLSLSTVLKYWRLIALIILIASFISAGITLLIPNQYESSALMKSASPNSSVEQNNSVLNLSFIGGSKVDAPTQFALTLMESRVFFQSLYDEDRFLAQMFALDFKDSDPLSFNPNMYDAKNSKWVKGKPGFDDARNIFLEEHFSVKADAITGFINFSMIHRNPVVAKEWIDLVYQKLNLYVKSQKIEEAKLALNYLKNEINSTNVPELRKIFADGINEQTKLIMLSEITDDFVFSYIDPPFIPSSKKSPLRSVIVLVSAIGSAFMAIILLLLLDSMGKSIKFNLKPFIFKIEAASKLNHKGLNQS